MKSNVQKMMEAFGEIILLCQERDYPVGELVEIEKIAEKAKSIPLRNCDMGTAEEQEDRFDAFCKHQMYKSGYMSCPDCPIYRKDEHYCKLRWAQMPYEEAKGV